MIDTLKIFTQINKNTYEIIKYKSKIKTCFNVSEEKIYYEIVNDSLKGSYDSALSVRVEDGSLFNLPGYVIIVEGSYHKIMRGQNAYDGFYNLNEITLGLIKLVENGYEINLPSLQHWFLQRIDVTKVFDLEKQENVCNYINNFRLLSYPRRNLKFYENESVYVSGQTTTLKIYNKYREFVKNDKFRLKEFVDFDLYSFMNKISSYIRFECEVKKKKLKDIYKNNFIRVRNIRYEDLESVWRNEFMKILKFSRNNENMKKVRTKDEVLKRLNTFYKTTRASVLYAFYLSLIIDGYKKTAENTSKTTFYRKMSQLKDAGVDISQSNNVIVVESKIIDFDPFLSVREVS